MKKIFVLAAVLALAAPVFSGVGTTAMDILKLPSGIRSQAMGGAYMALSDSLEALDMNPAGLAGIDKQDIMLVHNIYLQEVFFDSVYWAMGIEGAGSIGVSLKFLSAGNAPETLENPDGSYQGETGNSVSGFNYLAGVAYAVNLGKIAYGDVTKNINIGLAIKLTGEMIDTVAGSDYSGMGISADVGVTYVIPIEDEDFLSNRGQMLWNRITLALVTKNLGTSLGGEATPMSFAFGASTQLINIATSGNRVRVAFDADYSIDSGINIRGGLEYLHTFGNYGLALRLGGNFCPEERLESGFTAGAGVNIKLGQSTYSVDYAFMPYSEFGSGHKVGLYIKF